MIVSMSRAHRTFSVLAENLDERIKVIQVIYQISRVTKLLETVGKREREMNKR